MSILKKSFEVFREKIFVLLGLQIIYAVLASLLVFFGYRAIYDRMQLLGSYGPGLSDLLTQLENQDLQNVDISVANLQVGNVGFIVNLVRFLMIGLPILFFLLYFLFEGIGWDLVSRKKVNLKEIFDYKYLFNFTVVSLIFFAVIYGINAFLFSSLVLGNYIIIMPIIFLILFYFLFINYGLLHKYRQIFVTLKESFITGFKKIYVLLPLMLLFVVVFALLLLLVRAVNSLAIPLTLFYVIYILEALAVLIYFVYFKLFWTLFLDKY